MSVPTQLAPLPAEVENNSRDGFPVRVDLKIITPGLVEYQDMKNTAGETVTARLLIRKDALDRMCVSAEGRPIVYGHRKIDPKEFDRGSFHGVVTGPALFNAADGFYHAPGMVWNKSTLRHIENGDSISCAYVPKKLDTKAGVYNDVAYDGEVLDGGEYTHFAVVPNPRYNDARIEILNSKEGVMGLLSFFRKDKPEEKVEFDPATATVDVGGGKSIPLQELVNSYKTLKTNEPVKCGLEDLIEVDGKKVPVKELLNAQRQVLENALKDEHEKGDHKDAKENCGLCNSAAEEAKKTKEAEERQNAAAAAEAEAKRKKEDELQNAAKEKTAKEQALAKAKELEELRNKGKVVDMPSIKSLDKLMKEGEARYGEKTPAGVK